MTFTAQMIIDAVNLLPAFDPPPRSYAYIVRFWPKPAQRVIGKWFLFHNVASFQPGR